MVRLAVQPNASRMPTTSATTMFISTNDTLGEGGDMTRVSDEPRQGTRGWVKRHAVATYFVLAYAISWLDSRSARLQVHVPVHSVRTGPCCAHRHLVLECIGSRVGAQDRPLARCAIFGALAGFIPSLAFLTLDTGLGEEPGWRGFALPGLEATYTPIAATAALVQS
jgi:hypothetical protein